MKKIKLNDSVRFTGAVIARTMHDAAVANMRGTVIGFRCGGKLCIVDTKGSYYNEDGIDVRTIPTANLEVIK